MKRLLTLACACLAALAVAAVTTVTAGAASHQRTAKVSAADKQYLKTSIQGDLFEITGGKLAKAKSHNAAVLRLANRLVTDHSKSLSDAAKLARSFGIDVPTKPLPSQVWELNMVASLRGKAFNHWYSSLEVGDHIQDIQETSDEVSDGTNTKVRDTARMELPMLHEHLKLARAALAASPKG